MGGKVLIGIHGKPRAGKDTIANRLVSKYGFIRYGAGDPVKRATAAMFDIAMENLYHDQLKDTRNEFWNMTYREMAQKVGKESSRDVFGEDFWLRHIEKKLATLPVEIPGLVLADVRYANEAVWVRQRGGLVLFVERINRPQAANEQHAAEQALDPSLADVIIPNNGTVQELWEKVDLIVEPLWTS